MAKFEEASEDVVKLFDEVRDNTNIPQWVEFKVLCNNKQKNEVCKIIKSNDLVQVLSEGINFAVVINENIFNELPEDLQKMAVDECLAGVQISETDTVSLEKPDFCTYTGVQKKYGDTPVVVLHESVKTLYDAQKQKEDEEKAATKGKRGRKKGVFES
jgi:hypothetical protein